MRRTMSSAPTIQVDMVPLIDIITLLLMFLVIVGGMAKASHAVSVNLPRADQALPEKNLPVILEGRIVLSLKSVNGVYYAFTDPQTRYEISPRNAGNLSALSSHLLQSAEYMHRKNQCTLRDDGTYDIPVKLRIGEEVPMKTVEDALDAVVKSKLRDIHYGAQLPVSEAVKNP